MQNKVLIYGVVGVAVVALGVGAFMVMGHGGSEAGSATTTSQTVAHEQTQNTTLKNLIAMSGSHKCTFSSATAQTNSSGTAYIAGGQLRLDATSVVAGKTTESHMIVKGDTNYVWSSASPMGFKMAFSAMATQSDANPQPTVDPNANVDYRCSTWVADASMFELPKNIEFRDMSQLIPKGIPGMTQ